MIDETVAAARVLLTQLEDYRARLEVLREEEARVSRKLADFMRDNSGDGIRRYFDNMTDAEVIASYESWKVTRG